MENKEKKIKIRRKTTGTDIFSRILTCIVALAIPAVAYFANMIYYVVESSVFKLWAQIKGDTSDDGSTYGYLGFHTFVKEILPIIRTLSSDKVDWNQVWQSLEPVRTGLIVTLSFLAAAIVIALVIFFISAFSNSNIAPLIASVLGLASTMGMFFAFKSLSDPIVNGEISMTDFFESSIVASLLPFLATFSTLNLSSAWVLMLVFYFGLIVWHGAMLLVNSGENREIKVQKKK